jgi:hypothetical protein
MSRDDLIARLEAATGPDRELDAVIALAVGLDIGRSRAHSQDSRVPAYTASIGAALTLVPNGMRRRTVVYEDGRAGVQLWWPTDPLPDAWGKAYDSEPIATVIAALRAKGGE